MANEQNKEILQLTANCEFRSFLHRKFKYTRSCDFVITRLISDQIALHSVQLPLFISSVRLESQLYYYQTIDIIYVARYLF